MYAALLIVGTQDIRAQVRPPPDPGSEPEKIDQAIRSSSALEQAWGVWRAGLDPLRWEERLIQTLQVVTAGIQASNAEGEGWQHRYVLDLLVQVLMSSRIGLPIPKLLPL